MNSTPRKKVSLFATFRIKLHGRRRKTALSSRWVRPKIEPCLNILAFYTSCCSPLSERLEKASEKEEPRIRHQSELTEKAGKCGTGTGQDHAIVLTPIPHKFC